MTKHLPFPERLALIRKGENDCWLWIWAKTPRGYGHFRRDRLDVYAHRAAYELLVGRIPDGTEIDHSCRNTSCCNPAHMTPREPAKHTARHAAVTLAERTHCHRGHQLLPVQPDTWHRYPNGQRICRLCYEGWIAVRWADAATKKAYRDAGRPPKKRRRKP